MFWQQVLSSSVWVSKIQNQGKIAVEVNFSVPDSKSGWENDKNELTMRTASDFGYKLTHKKA